MKPICLKGHSRPIKCVLFNLTGDFLFTCSVDGRICCWDVEDGALLIRYKTIADNNEVEKAVWGIDVTFDSSRLIVASAAGVFIFEVETGKQLAHIPMNSVCKYVQWNKNPKHQTSFVASKDSFTTLSPASILIYSSDNSESEDDYQIRLSIENKFSKCTCVSWGPYDLTLVSAHDDGLIIVWNSATGQKMREIKAHTKCVTCLDFSSNQIYCLSSSLDGTAKLWTLHNFEEIQVYNTDRPLNSCSISPLFSAPESKRRAHILVAGGQSASEVTTTKSREGKQEAVLIHMIKGDILGFIPGHFSPVNSIKFMPNGKGFITGAEEGNAHIYKFDQSYFDSTKFS